MTDTNNDGAARWASCLDDGPLTDDDARALRAWLDVDPRRSGALLRAEACLARVRRLRAAGGVAVPMTVSGHMAALLRRHLGRRRLAAVAAAAMVAATVLLWPAGVSLSTARGEVRRVPLNDGSVVAINTASSLRVAIDDGQRRIMLDRGEAWFQVAHDRARPFVVEAGGIEVRAVGTAFSVRRRDDGIDLLVTEGVVEARRDGTLHGWRVRAGEKAFLAVDGTAPAPVAVPAGVERELAWRQGELALEGQTLGEAAGEINRYNLVQIAVDPVVAATPLIGFFRIDDPVAFAQSAAAVAHGRTVRDGDTIRIVAGRRFHDSSE